MVEYVLVRQMCYQPYVWLVDTISFEKLVCFLETPSMDISSTLNSSNLLMNSVTDILLSSIMTSVSVYLGNFKSNSISIAVVFFASSPFSVELGPKFSGLLMKQP